MSDKMTEAQEQIAVIKWTQQSSIRNLFPDLKLLFHVPNENKDVKQVKIAKALGVKKGVPDLFLPVARGDYHGLAIEMKAETGRPSEAQKWWVRELANQGWKAMVCHGHDEAIAVLTWYMNLNVPQPKGLVVRQD